MTLALTALAVFLMAYAALAALTWVRRLTGERPARRRAMAPEPRAAGRAACTRRARHPRCTRLCSITAYRSPPGSS
jgi:hypothetical protein